MKKREITDDMLYGYFAGDVSEEKAISSWLAADDRNRKRYRVARQLYEQHLLNSPADVLEWRDRQSSKRASFMRHLWIAAANVAAVAVIAIVAIYVVPERISGRLAAAMTTVEARPGQQLEAAGLFSGVSRETVLSACPARFHVKHPGRSVTENS